MTISLTLDQLQAMCATPAGRNRAITFLQPINEAFADPKWGITTARRAAYFLAQCLHECGEFRYMSELADGKAYDNRKDLGNTRPEALAIAKGAGTTPGPMWKGHGLIQITGYDNHLDASMAIFGDNRAVREPALLTQPKYAVLASLWFWVTNGLNDLADADLFTKVTKRINGGTNGLDDRLMYLKRCNDVFRSITEAK